MESRRKKSGEAFSLIFTRDNIEKTGIFAHLLGISSWEYIK